MSAATIFFMDLVGFSKKPTAEQRSLIDSLNEEVTNELKPLLPPPHEDPSLLAMPTGDGMALAFLHRDKPPWDLSTILKLALRLHRWSWARDQSGKSVSIRIGIHMGVVDIVTDINGRLNVCGDTINRCQRVMDAANPRQVLFSETAFRHYIGMEDTVLTDPPFSQESRGRFRDPIEVYAKHDLRIMVHALELDPAEEYMSAADPVAGKLMVVGLTDLPKEIVGTFSSRLERANRIAFVQLTGDRFLDAWESDRIRFSDELERFWVFMPDPEAYGRLDISQHRPLQPFLTKCVERWRKFLARFHAERPSVDLKLGLFCEPPYFGGSFLDWGQPGGRIHISPYIWNVVANECPGYDMEWIGSQPSPVYSRYVNGLDFLHTQTDNAI